MIATAPLFGLVEQNQGPSLPHCTSVGQLGRGGKADDLHCRSGGGDLTGCGDTAQPRHMDVHHHQIWAERFGELDGDLTVLSLTNDLNVRWPPAARVGRCEPLRGRRQAQHEYRCSLSLPHWIRSLGRASTPVSLPHHGFDTPCQQNLFISDAARRGA